MAVVFLTACLDPSFLMIEVTQASQFLSLKFSLSQLGVLNLAGASKSPPDVDLLKPHGCLGPVSGDANSAALE